VAAVRPHRAARADAVRPGVAGVAAALAASAIWGTAPVFFAALAHVPPLELLAHRVLWGAAVVVAFCLATGRGARLAATVMDPAALAPLAASALLVSANWFTFLWAVQAGRVTEAGIGYYLMPLVSVLLGVLVLGERLGARRWAAVGCAALGVGLLSAGLGAAPWVPLILAGTFSVYGLIRRRVGTGAVTGFAVETLLLAPLALGWLAAVHLWGIAGPTGRAGGLFGTDAATTLLLILAGPVTGVPLILFAEAARRLAYATAGMIQYLNPTLQVAVAILVLGEAVTPWHGAALAAVWTGLALYTSGIRRQERARARASAASSGVSTTSA